MLEKTVPVVLAVLSRMVVCLRSQKAKGWPRDEKKTEKKEERKKAKT